MKTFPIGQLEPQSKSTRKQAAPTSAARTKKESTTLHYTTSAAGRRVIITQSSAPAAEPVPPFLSGPCPACGEPLARPGVVARYHKWYHEACLPAKSTQAQTRGGAREGAGRKPLPPGQKAIRLTLTLPPALHAYLKSLPPGSIVKILEQHQKNNLTA